MKHLINKRPLRACYNILKPPPPTMTSASRGRPRLAIAPYNPRRNYHPVSGLQSPGLNLRPSVSPPIKSGIVPNMKEKRDVPLKRMKQAAMKKHRPERSGLALAGLKGGFVRIRS
jgi:hypothetical protein